MRILWGMAACLLVASCTASTEGNDETDRQAATLADAISFPRQSSAAGFARAALAAWKSDSALSVLEMTELDASKQEDPLAHLVIRIHRDADDAGPRHHDELNACYGMDFNYWGIIGKPDRTGCPENAVPINPPGRPDWKQPDSYDRSLRFTLGNLPADADFGRVVRTLQRMDLMETRSDDPEKRTSTPDPAVGIVVGEKGVGVSFKGSDGQCLLGSRDGTGVHLQRPEAAGSPCDGKTALTVH
ncbi:hypothetical protein [Actinocrispum sp. NPDC049592]|uniref:hypothetical protein n=1 Tax=Actinocrispum sp. NPDC049592 TaxID=3154835 RepID=UPI003425E6F4